MDDKISQEAITQYSTAYANKLLDAFFQNKNTISGKEILSFSDVQQVNLFIVRELFRTWREETKKLKSPYFDYHHPDVKSALETFMNVLSKYISIERKNFEPLVKNSVLQTLLVIFTPYDYFSSIISGNSNKLDVSLFKEELKYLRINKAPLEQMLKKLEEQHRTELPGNEAFGVLDQILEEVHFTPEDPDPYIAQFSSVALLDSDKFYITKTEDVTPEPKARQEITTVHDSLIQEPKPTLADNFRKIDRIKDRLTINQKFMFTKVLFQGDFDLFSKTIEELDSLPDMPSALTYLNRYYATWDKESEEFNEFIEMLEKRFS
jgi:hypothetical protein